MGFEALGDGIGEVVLDGLHKGSGWIPEIDPDGLSTVSRWFGRSIKMGFKEVRDGSQPRQWSICMGFEAHVDGLANPF